MPLPTRLKDLPPVLVMAPNMRGNVTERTEAQKRYIATSHAMILMESQRQEFRSRARRKNKHPHLSVCERKDFSRIRESDRTFPDE